jgi:hypothetical protein
MATHNGMYFDALFDRGQLRKSGGGSFRLVLKGAETLSVGQNSSTRELRSPKQVAARWASFLQQRQADFSATFRIGEDVDVLTLNLGKKPIYKRNGDKLIFAFRPFNDENRALIKGLAGLKLGNFNLFSSASQLPIPKSLLKEYEQVLATPIGDGAKWQMKPSDAYFTGLAPEDIADWRQRNSPFLLNNRQWDSFVHDLYAALDSDGFVAPHDIRLNGSAARLFSNPTKNVPSSARDGIILYESETKSEISQEKAKDILINYDQWLGPERQRGANDIPRYRTVDLMAKLGIGDRSDIDLQITSDVIAKKVVEVAAQAGIDKDKVKNSTYGFYNKELVSGVLPNTSEVMKKWSSAEDIGIDFTFALFDGVGPLNSIAHFRNSDWLVGIPNSSGFDSPVWYSSDWTG